MHMLKNNPNNKTVQLMKQLILLLFIVSNFATTACEFESVSFKTDFSTAHIDECKQLGKSNYLLIIKPENYPINNSPWYSFKVIATEQQKIHVTIKYEQGKHRYKPKISNNKKNWSPLKHRVSKGNLKFKLDVSEKPVWVSAQEIVSNKFYHGWLNKLSENPQNKIYQLGKSTEGRPIYQLINQSATNEWVIIVGRMHPPEVTGAMALFIFSEMLLSDDIKAKQFRDRFNILLIPNLNPDGVEHGFWRSNINGVDINRDWKKFKQQETILVRNQIENIVSQGGKIVFALDFHSTHDNVFYTMPSDYGIVPPMLVENWLTSLDKAMPDFKVTIKPGGSAKSGVFKQYIADTYGVHAITYEMADDIERQKIIKVANSAASLFMEKLLDTPKEDFYISK